MIDATFVGNVIQSRYVARDLSVVVDVGLKSVD